jgi:hypothetical protein
MRSASGIGVLARSSQSVDSRRQPRVFLSHLLSVWSPGAMTLQCGPRWARGTPENMPLAIADKYSLNLCTKDAICIHYVERTIQKYSSISLAEVMSYNTFVEIMSRFVASVF